MTRLVLTLKAPPSVTRAVGVGCFTLGLLLWGGEVSAQIANVPGWKLMWHDEFDGDQIDTTKWAPLDRRDSYNNEKQYYHPDQVEVIDGELRLTAIDTPRQGKNYQSGLVTSKELFGPGRFEARIDLPTSQGMWPAFWLNANQVQWPLGGEIDIMENRGSQSTRVSSAYHWQAEPGPCCDLRQLVTRPYIEENPDGTRVNFHETFNTYAVEWDEDELRFYVNGNLYHTVTEEPGRPIIDTPKNLILNLAVGGDFGGDPNPLTEFPQTMRIDYVRVWQRQEEPLGDYNQDGRVDAADFTRWRDTLGQTGLELAADGSGNGAVDPSDYDLWRDNYQQAPAPTTAVPEAGLTAGAVATIAALAAKRPSRQSMSDKTNSTTPPR